MRFSCNALHATWGMRQNQILGKYKTCRTQLIAWKSHRVDAPYGLIRPKDLNETNWESISRPINVSGEQSVMLDNLTNKSPITFLVGFAFWFTDTPHVTVLHESENKIFENVFGEHSVFFFCHYNSQSVADRLEEFNDKRIEVTELVK